MDAVYGMNFVRDVHPYDRRLGRVRALETIRFAIPTHRGCYGECHFCAIAVHEGPTVQLPQRRPRSSARRKPWIAGLPGFKGYLHDVGGTDGQHVRLRVPQKARTGAPVPEPALPLPRRLPGIPPARPPAASLRCCSRLREIPGRQAGRRRLRHPPPTWSSRTGHRASAGTTSARSSATTPPGRSKTAPEHTGGAGPGEAWASRAALDSLPIPRPLPYALVGGGAQGPVPHLLPDRRPPRLQRSGHGGAQPFRRPGAGEPPRRGPALHADPLHHLHAHVPHERDPFSGKGLFVEKTAARRERQKKILVAKTGLLRYGMRGSQRTQKEVG